MSSGPVADLQELSDLLDREWDPIGVYSDSFEDEWPPGEYGEYANWIFQALRSGDGRSKILELMREARGRMDLGDDPLDDGRSVDAVLAWWQDRTELGPASSTRAPRMEQRQPVYVRCPGGWVVPVGRRGGWDWLPPGSSQPLLNEVPAWVRWLFHRVVVQRYAANWLWDHGGWAVEPAPGYEPLVAEFIDGAHGLLRED